MKIRTDIAALALAGLCIVAITVLSLQHIAVPSILEYLSTAAIGAGAGIAVSPTVAGAAAAAASSTNVPLDVANALSDLGAALNIIASPAPAPTSTTTPVAAAAPVEPAPMTAPVTPTPAPVAAAPALTLPASYQQPAPVVASGSTPQISTATAADGTPVVTYSAQPAGQ